MVKVQAHVCVCQERIIKECCWSKYKPMCVCHQERMKEELRKRHKQERDAAAAKLDQESQREESELRNRGDGELEQLLREKKNRNAAELAARTDLSQDQLAEVSQ